MPWQSPYRGEESPTDRLSPRAKSLISRGTMLAIGLLLAWFAAAGISELREFATFATTQTASPSGFRPRGTAPVGGWIFAIVMGFVGATMIAAALLPVSAMQSLFERFGRPPVTGDRSPETDDYYNPFGSRRRYDRWWWDWRD